MDEMLKGYVIEGLNEIKRLAILINDGDLRREQIYDASSSIVGEADKIIEEINQ